MKIEVKDNNIEQALRVLKRKLQRDGFFKVVKLKSVYEKPSEKKKRILQENIKRVKKLNKLKNLKMRTQVVFYDEIRRGNSIKKVDRNINLKLKPVD